MVVYPTAPVPVVINSKLVSLSSWNCLMIRLRSFVVIAPSILTYRMPNSRSIRSRISNVLFQQENTRLEDVINTVSWHVLKGALAYLLFPEASFSILDASAVSLDECPVGGQREAKGCSLFLYFDRHWGFWSSSELADCVQCTVVRSIISGLLLSLLLPMSFGDRHVGHTTCNKARGGPFGDSLSSVPDARISQEQKTQAILPFPSRPEPIGPSWAPEIELETCWVPLLHSSRRCRIACSMPLKALVMDLL